MILLAFVRSLQYINSGYKVSYIVCNGVVFTYSWQPTYIHILIMIGCRVMAWKRHDQRNTQK